MIVRDTYRGAAVLKFSSPPVNAISFATLDDLLDTLQKAVADPQVRGIVISGGPVQFSAGADLAIFQGIRSDADAVYASRVFQEAFQAIEDSPKPVLAAVAGHVLGGALELAMACHFRMAAEGSRFSMPEVNLGINPGAGGTQRLPRLIGLEPALDMLLGGQARRRCPGTPVGSGRRRLSGREAVRHRHGTAGVGPADPQDSHAAPRKWPIR